MAKNQYQDFRQEIIDFIQRDVVGPFSENEVIDDAPATKYSAGILFPQSVESGEKENNRAENLDVRSRDDEEVVVIEQATSFYPSALGLSFSVSDKVNELKLEVAAARYAPIGKTDANLVSVPTAELPEKYFQHEPFSAKFDYKDGELRLKEPLSKVERDILIETFRENEELKRALYKIYRLFDNGWKRIPIQQNLTLNLAQSKTELLIENEHMKVFVLVKPLQNGLKLCTVSLVNTATTEQSQNDHKQSYFQVSMSLTDSDKSGVFEDLGKTEFTSKDPEELSLKLLFRKKRFYATGHGCSAMWLVDNSSDKARLVKTETLPSYIVPQMTFDLFTEANIQKPDLRMATMAYEKDDKVLESLKKLFDAYKAWIEGLNTTTTQLNGDLKKTAERHIELCKEAAQRMFNGIKVLKENSAAMKSFKLANEAMLMQRVHSNLQSEKRFPDEPVSMPQTYNDSSSNRPSEWRPFQIAFLVMGVESLSNENSEFKDIVDLIWFPTGGGKTEAYLGLTAFTIFYRRLTNSNDSSGGTTVLMRYTLRLLTSQQFQRACTLICACEKLRRKHNDLGTTIISIGLWLGGSSTPNSIDEAQTRLQQLQNQDDSSMNNPFQVLSCPWCGTHMVKKEFKDRKRGVLSYQIKTRPSRFIMWCPNNSCDYHEELPVMIVDDDIYREAPTLLFGTVDKFAQLPWKAQAAKIFALDAGNPALSPELIIQDELHLISGSLGTVVGMYESAIDIMCSAKGQKPKIIASTATIRRAKEQCNALYARDVRQFPSPGLDSSDSFFAREAAITSEAPGRLYLGVMPSGATATWMQIKLMANAIQSVEFIDYPDEVKDKYWTQVVYCNSIRELGTAKSVAYDDVKAYSSTLADKYRKKIRGYADNNVQELTSRIPAESIPEILQRLNIQYPNRGAIDTLLATNMISVGVDIDRLGIMLILGQPKTTSEYIQASSRVGRQYPGLVITLFSPVKSRDRSHYEQFVKYHQSLYRYVEPTSVTPFSAPVRDKALHAVIITLIRHYIGIEKSEQLESFDPSSDKLREVISLILERVSKVDSAEVEPTKKEVDRIINTISDITKMGDSAMFGPANAKDKTALMRYPNTDDHFGHYSTLQSMRSTDVECIIRLDYTV